MAEENQAVEAEAAAPAAAPAQEAAQEQQAGPELNVSDLQGLRSIIEVASQRGAFKANELESVGKAFNKLSSVLEAVAEQQKEA